MVSQEEQRIFDAFIATEPNFAGEALNWSVGEDPPDILCENRKGLKIGVELGEWLDEAQTERTRALKALELELSKKAIEQGFADWLSRYGVIEPDIKILTIWP